MNWGPQSKTLLESDSSEANNFAESLVSFRDKDWCVEVNTPYPRGAGRSFGGKAGWPGLCTSPTGVDKIGKKREPEYAGGVQSMLMILWYLGSFAGFQNSIEPARAQSRCSFDVFC